MECILGGILKMLYAYFPQFVRTSLSPSLRIGRRSPVPFVGQLFQVQKEPTEPIDQDARKKPVNKATRI